MSNVDVKKLVPRCSQGAFDYGPPAGSLAFFAACGLLGGALVVVGEHIYLIVEGTRHSLSAFNHELVADNLSDMLWEGGLMLGLAAALYLLAPSPPSALAPSPPSPTVGAAERPGSPPVS